MSTDALLIIAMVVGFLCGWFSHWQWSRAWEKPDDEWGDVFDRWDRS